MIDRDFSASTAASDSTFASALFDQLNIETPEQVDLRLPVAGIGSRFIAIVADSAIQIIAEVLLILLAVLFVSAFPQNAATHALDTPELDTAGKWVVAAIVLFHFLLYWGYFSLFEAFWNGQTPGKRLAKIRVIKDSGRQITLFEALARNLLRVIDSIPGVYFVGLISMLCNSRQKRLGDFVAETMVVHERTFDQPLMGHNSRSITASFYPQPQLEMIQRTTSSDLPADAVARLGSGDLNVIESFFARALDFELDTRAAMATRIAASMSAKMNFPVPDGMNPERFLEAIVSAMRSQGRP